MTDDEPAIQAEGLHTRFGAVHAVNDVTLTVPAGTVLGLLGPNRACHLVLILGELFALPGGREGRVRRPWRSWRRTSLARSSWSG
jgi:ABC-type uncharacterized transport system ATPase subunit